MARIISFTPADDEQKLTVSIVRDQKTVMNVTDGSENLKFVVGNTPGGDLVVEIPSTGGAFDLSPEKLVVLKEGSTYPFNIWDYTNAADPMRIATGSLTVENSIAASGAEHATQFLEDATRVVVLEQLQYDVLPPEEKALPGIIYAIPEE